MMSKSKLLIAAGVIVALVVPAWAADSVTAVSWGGAYQDSVRKAFFEPFMKDTGDKIVEEEFNGEIAKSGGGGGRKGRGEAAEQAEAAPTEAPAEAAPAAAPAEAPATELSEKQPEA